MGIVDPRLVAQIARNAGINPQNFVNQIKQESGFRTNTNSSAGARGVAQIVAKYHPEAPGPNDPVGQLKWAANYMSNQIKHYGNWQDALSVYNSGRPWAQGQQIGETNRYVNNILGDHQNMVNYMKTGTSPNQPNAPTQNAKKSALLKYITDSNNALLQNKPVPSILPTILSMKQSELGAQGIAVEGAQSNSKADQGALTLIHQYLGSPYHWGGSTPKTGFDCSGLLQYVWSKQGVNIPRTTYQQWKAGLAVSKNHLQPGDAVFFEPSTQGPGHVGMYLGNDRFIESPHTGANVRISSLSGRSDFVGARRFV